MESQLVTRPRGGLTIPRTIVVLLLTTAFVAASCSPTADPSPAPGPTVAVVTVPPAAATGSSDPVASDPAGIGYTTVTCHVPAPPGGRPAGYIKSCGILRVPENRARPDSRIIRLRVVVIGSDDPNPAPDPILFVSHGAGGATILPSLDQPVLDTLRKHRDVILVDGRGTGGSSPGLDCHEADQAAIDGLTLDRAEAAAAQLDALVACRERLATLGTDLAGYSSAEIAADMADLRTALGYDAWNLYGVSYGTREELGIMRAHPAGIRSVILDSVLPPDVDALAEWGPNAALQFETLFDGCASDPACSTAHPDLEKTFDELVAQLDAEPITLDFDDPWARTTRTGRATGDTLIIGLFQALYPTAGIGRLPGQIDGIPRGETDLLEYALALQANAFGAEAVYFPVFCRDDFAWTDASRIAAASKAVDRLRVAEPFEFWAKFDLDGCAAFGAGRGDPSGREPVVSDIPTLILSGEYDPITPPHWGASAAATLSRATHVVFRGVGHGVVGTNACAERIANAFLEDPAASVEAACAAELPWPKFRD